MRFLNEEINVKKLLETAEASLRQRATQSLKPGEYPGIRLLANALMPDTYIQPHKHNWEGGDEIWQVLEGEILPIEFDERGEIRKESKLIVSSQSNPIVIMGERTFHTLLVRKPTVILEITKGPYNPATYKDFAEWAPAEDTPEVKEYLAGLKNITNFFNP